MEANIIAAEIDLNLIPHQLRHRTDFNETQVLAYLSGLSTYYHEALIIVQQNHLLILVTGKSPQLLVQAMRSFADDVAIVSLHRTTQASRNLFYKIVKGESWKGVDSLCLHQAIDQAVKCASIADALGSSLTQLVKEGKELHNFAHRSYTWETKRMALIKYPTISDFDFEKSCLN
ncbi:hypothetical protein SanaruYs_25860 [Chryseotalea sanaruensis]|uniref:Uncharacterized protein n=1 Tax=Chryseotalea sanaruensis TaxID=2482724 RepID=A0A401UBT4_9BACT|nr:hypothetical protein [Chryseotalea sanaruensis]GCC52349.1 hypothetical protein SanaruYs_25860 [Chryseotalea sanaruensis]